jgi:hypothetical protein
VGLGRVIRYVLGRRVRLRRSWLSGVVLRELGGIVRVVWGVGRVVIRCHALLMWVHISAVRRHG